MNLPVKDDYANTTVKDIKQAKKSRIIINLGKYARRTTTPYSLRGGHWIQHQVSEVKYHNRQYKTSPTFSKSIQLQGRVKLVIFSTNKIAVHKLIEVDYFLKKYSTSGACWAGFTAHHVIYLAALKRMLLCWRNTCRTS